MGASSRRLGHVHVLLLVALLLLECSTAPVQALRRRHTTAARAALQETVSSSIPQKRHSIAHTPFNSEASLQIAARQRLFDYAVTEALDLLDEAAKNIHIPEYKTTLDIPLIGGIDVSVSNVNITNLQVPRKLAKVAIESGYYHLKASNLTAQVRAYVQARTRCLGSLGLSRWQPLQQLQWQPTCPSSTCLLLRY
eukprot:GHRQ01020052.1.p1 GENE.GHRQ01020052.1~~GHRQ01020052.1.p1  ORF type:complete len:195 (+),score=41.92 GHRQ01020052.1:454-1038(+)